MWNWFVRLCIVFPKTTISSSLIMFYMGRTNQMTGYYFWRNDTKIESNIKVYFLHFLHFLCFLYLVSLFRCKILLRYNTTVKEHLIVVVQAFYQNDTVKFLLTKESVLLAPSSSYHLSNRSLLLLKYVNYSINVINTGNSTIWIDSVILIPNYHSSKIYKNSDSNVRAKLQESWNKGLQLIVPRGDCFGLLFLFWSEINNGTVGKSIRFFQFLKVYINFLITYIWHALILTF